MSEASISHRAKKRILFGTTVGLSAMALLRGQLAWFREQGWDITLVSSPDSDAKCAANREQVAFLGIPMKRNISLLHDLKSAVDWVRLLWREGPEVVNLGTPKASLLGSLAAWTRRVPRRIYTVRGLRLEGSSGLMSRLLWLMEWATIRMATDVIAVSPSLGAQLVSQKLASPRDIWIIGQGSSNGVDTEAIQNRIAKVDKDSLRLELGIEPTKFVVGFIGRVGPSKGFDILADALKHEEISEIVELLVVGSIEDVKLGKAIDEMGNHAHIVPWTDDVWRFLPAMDLLILPTLREGFPNSVLEAAAAGIPAVTTRATGAIDSVIDGETGFLIDVDDVEALADRINSLAKDPDLLFRLGVNAKQRAERQFRPQDIWRGIEAIAEGRHGVAEIKRLDQYLESRELK